MRYLLWQFRHMHTLHFDINHGVPTCPTCGGTYQKRTKSMTKNPSTPKPAKAPKSTLVLSALILLVAAIFLVAAAALLALPYLAVLAVVDGLAAVTFAVLSLRERG